MTLPVNEWEDMMPHAIAVQSWLGADEYGEDRYGSTQKYKCLFDDTLRIVRTDQGEEVQVNRTAYVFPVPYDPPGQTIPVPIKTQDKATVETGPGAGSVVRPIVTAASHYWKDGTLHNIELTFS